jgi:hypothetical protein
MSASRTPAACPLTVNTPSDLVDRWIVTEEDGQNVVSFVSAAARHYLRSGDTIREVAVTNTAMRTLVKLTMTMDMNGARANRSSGISIDQPR